MDITGSGPAFEDSPAKSFVVLGEYVKELVYEMQNRFLLELEKSFDKFWGLYRYQISENLKKILGRA